MSATRLIKHIHLSYFSKPIANRAIFRAIGKIQASRLVMVGLGDGQLACKMVQLARQLCPEKPIQLTAIDQFDLRADGRGLRLKEAHQMLHAAGARTRLVPGDPFTALARAANTLPETDLIVVQADQLGEQMDRAWLYLPRMLQAHSLVFLENADAAGIPQSYEALDFSAVNRRVRHDRTSRRAA